MLKQVSKIFTKTTNYVVRYAIRNKSSKVLFPLQRGGMRVEGPEAPDFLQGLITNDMDHFDEGARSIYAMFLNTKGRVILDALIHKWREPNYFIIECDKEVLGTLHAHLSIYKLRRDVKLQKLPDFQTWVIYGDDSNTVPKSSIQEVKDDEIQYFNDPRLEGLGIRVLSLTASKSLPEVITTLSTFANITSVSNEEAYRTKRYSLGVAEGAADIPPGTCFPLEINCDYLHGVSFHKGCYIGQEVTARIHHTGVVRKRLLPLKFAGSIYGDVKPNCVIRTQSNLNIGKLRGYSNGWGIGLMKMKEACEARELLVEHNTVQVFKPDWWPIEAPKEKIKPPSDQ